MSCQVLNARCIKIRGVFSNPAIQIITIQVPLIIYSNGSRRSCIHLVFSQPVPMIIMEVPGRADKHYWMTRLNGDRVFEVVVVKTQSIGSGIPTVSHVHTFNSAVGSCCWERSASKNCVLRRLEIFLTTHKKCRCCHCACENKEKFPFHVGRFRE